MVMVRAVIPNPDDLLRPGMSFAVKVLIPGEDYATVPELALQWEKGESFVWRVRDGAAEKLTVRSVKRLNQIVLVDGDIRQGDLVVVEGVQRLRPGREVSYSAPDSPAASAPGA
jgi:multidrug efflux pump subunit AcrA (membrane-fusion protein)